MCQNCGDILSRTKRSCQSLNLAISYGGFTKEACCQPYYRMEVGTLPLYYYILRLLLLKDAHHVVCVCVCVTELGIGFSYYDK